MFSGITLNNGTTLQFGDICHWYNPTCDGYNPVSQRIPDSINVNDYKTEISSLQVGVDSLITYLLGTRWDSAEEFGEYLDTIRSFMEEQVIWLWGSFENGGAFLYNNGTATSCGICTCWYNIKQNVAGAGAEPVYKWWIWTANSAGVPYRTENPTLPTIYEDTRIAFYNMWTRTPDVGDLLPPLSETPSLFYGHMTGYPSMYVDNTDTLQAGAGVDPTLWTWVQEQNLRYFTWGNYTSNYLGNYTSMVDMQGTGIDDHPWERYIQNRIGAVSGPYRLYPDIDDTIEVVGDYMGGSAIDESGNPYGGGTSGEDGGDGTGSEQSDNIDDGGLPSSSLIATGMASIYLPTTTNMADFASFLFNSITDSLEIKIKKLFANPIESILNVALCHLAIPYNSSSAITFAGISSGVSAPIASSIYHKVEYTIKLEEFWGSALDYSSYTKLKIYVPYCGIYDLNIDDFMGKPSGTLTLTYKIDILSGTCVAILKSTRYGKQGSLDSCLYQFSGNIFLSVPVTSTDWSNLFGSLMTMASVAIAPSPVSAVGMAESVMSQKVNIQKSGQIGSNYGYMGIQTPYIIIERPVQSIPANYGDYYGYPSNIYGKVSSFKGYTEFDTDTYWTDNFGHATAEECDMIKDIMNGGVYL